MKGAVGARHPALSPPKKKIKQKRGARRAAGKPRWGHRSSRQEVTGKQRAEIYLHPAQNKGGEITKRWQARKPLKARLAGEK